MKTNKYWIITIAYCLLPIAFGLSLSLFIRRLPDVSQPLSGQWQWIYSGHPVSQTITPRHDGLNVITVYLKNVSLRNQDPFYFTLADASGVIRKIDINGYNIGDGDNVRFQFLPIFDSKNLTLIFTLTSSSPQSAAIGAGFSDSAGSLAYQTYYFPTSRMVVLETAAGDFTNRLLRPRFILLAAAFLALFLIPLNFKHAQK
jgi:hypothetical protein